LAVLWQKRKVIDSGTASSGSSLLTSSMNRSASSRRTNVSTVSPSGWSELERRSMIA
jgi:hypothetical protein